MTQNASFRSVIVLWAAWVVLLTAYQALVTARLELARPDYALEWTETETTATSQNGKPYLMDPFLNDHVSWDSEFYLSIAVAGYDDPAVRAIGPEERPFALNYAFMPFYPFMIRLVAVPLGLLGLTPIATATLAGVIVSALGTLGGMLALYDLAQDDLGQAGGLRAAFYLIAFPSGFFLAQIYTEGLFTGLAFGCLALIRRRRLLLAAVLAALAAWTRAVGVALLIPLAIPWIQSGQWIDLDMEWKQIYFQGLPWRAIGRGLIAFAPFVAFLTWRVSPLGLGFNFVEEFWFGRGFFSLGTSFFTWSEAFRSLFGPNPQRAAYYLVEFLAIVIGFAGCIATWRRHPGVAWFSLAVVLLSFTSGPAQGMYRYVLGAPAVFIALSQWGRSPVFDRVWSLLSILLMGLMAITFTFDFWAG